MSKNPLKKSSGAIAISLQVSTKVRKVDVTLAPCSLLNPPKFFRRFMNGRTARSLALSKSDDNYIHNIWSMELLFVPLFKYMIRNSIGFEKLIYLNACWYRLYFIALPQALKIFTTYCHIDNI